MPVLLIGSGIVLATIAITTAVLWAGLGGLSKRVGLRAMVLAACALVVGLLAVFACGWIVLGSRVHQPGNPVLIVTWVVAWLVVIGIWARLTARRFDRRLQRL